MSATLANKTAECQELKAENLELKRKNLALETRVAELENAIDMRPLPTEPPRPQCDCGRDKCPRYHG